MKSKQYLRLKHHDVRHGKGPQNPDTCVRVIGKVALAIEDACTRCLVMTKKGPERNDLRRAVKIIRCTLKTSGLLIYDVHISAKPGSLVLKLKESHVRSIHAALLIIRMRNIIVSDWIDRGFEEFSRQVRSFDRKAAGSSY